MSGLGHELESALRPPRVTESILIRDEWSWCTVALPGSIPKKLPRMRDRFWG